MKHSIAGQIQIVQHAITIIEKFVHPVELRDSLNSGLNDAIISLEALTGIENPKEFVAQAKERNEFDKQFDAVSEELLKTEEDSDKYLRSQGLDPEEIAKNGVTFVNNLVKRIKGEERIKELETALRGVEQLCDNSNESHEQIWRIAYEALKK